MAELIEMRLIALRILPVKCMYCHSRVMRPTHLTKFTFNVVTSDAALCCQLFPVVRTSHRSSVLADTQWRAVTRVSGTR